MKKRGSRHEQNNKEIKRQGIFDLAIGDEEMEHVIIGYRNGEPVFGQEFTAEEIVAQLKASTEWAVFTSRFDMSNDANKTLFDWVIDEKLGDDPELSEYKNLLKAMIAAGGVVRVRGAQYEFVETPVVEPVVEPEVPTDRNGRPLTPTQIAWSEYRQWSETHSSADCKARARTDAGYGLFYRKNLEREAQGTESTQFRVVGQPTKPDVTSAPPELLAFAEEFRKTSMDQVRKLKSPTLNPLGWEKYQRNLDAALAAGLMGR
jgi:hypothetical protein